MISANIDKSTAAESYKELKIIGIEIAAGDDEVNSLKFIRRVIIP